MTGTRRAGKAPAAAPAPPTAPAPRAAKPARRPDPPPMEVDESKVILIGVVCWAIAFVVMLVFHRRLSDHGNGWYPWTALAGIGLGCWGWYLTRKRVAARLTERHERRES